MNPASEVTAPTPARPPRANPLLHALVILIALVGGAVLLVPFLVVAVGGNRVGAFSQPKFANTVAKMQRAEAMRPFTLPKDSSITPAHAGDALNSLHPSGTSNTRFLLKAVQSRPASPWPDDTLPPELFPTARSSLYTGGPASDRILGIAAAGVNAEELTFLAEVAHAPVWHTVETVGRARAVDIVGGRFVVPFPDDANLFEMPILKFAATKNLAYAGVSRAAYYLARNQKDSAEAALRAVTSLGFALADNGTLLIDQLIGAMIVGIGREALLQFYALTKNPAAAVLKARLDSIDNAVTARATATGTAATTRTRGQMIALVNDPRMPRGLRFEYLNSLALLPCTSVRALITGPTQDVTTAFERARRELARYPSEVAQIDLSSRLLDRPLPLANDDAVLPALAVDAATFASKIFRNPRLAACTSYLVQ